MPGSTPTGWRPATARNRANALDLFGLAAPRLPDEEPPFREGDDPVEQERERGQHDDAGEYGVDVERALGLQDEVADAARGAEVLAHDRPDERQADGVVQAREHPAHRAR